MEVAEGPPSRPGSPRPSRPSTSLQAQKASGAKVRVLKGDMCLETAPAVRRDRMETVGIPPAGLSQDSRHARGGVMIG